MNARASARSDLTLLKPNQNLTLEERFLQGLCMLRLYLTYDTCESEHLL